MALLIMTDFGAWRYGAENFGHFSNPEFDRLVDRAAGMSDPAQRQLLYIEAEQILNEQQAAIIPLFHTLFY
jgi:ABC-type oligopeptide transport system substrate-binding subunit